MNTGALLERLNFAIAVASNRIPGTRVDLKGFAQKDRSKILDTAISQILDNDVSPATRATLLRQVDQPLPDVKAAPEAGDAMDVPNMRQPGEQGGAGIGRHGYLLRPVIRKCSRS